MTSTAIATPDRPDRRQQWPADENRPRPAPAASWADFYASQHDHPADSPATKGATPCH